MVLVLTADGQRELGGVEQLDGKTTADLHLAFVVRGVQAQTCGRGPVTHRVGAELLDRLVRHDHVALGLRHLLVVGSRIQPDSVVLDHGRHLFSKCARSMVENSQVRMMS